MARRVRALRLTLAPHRAALALAAGRWRPDLYRGAPGSPLRLVEVAPPDRPAGWVRVRPTLAGICASDRKMLHLTGFGTTVMALYGIPRAVIPGHEVVGTVVEADTRRGAREGDRVVVEPLLSCTDKRLAQCARCAAGQDQACQRVGFAGTLARGQGFGHQARFGGGWSEELVAPARRLVPVPAGLSDRAAVLAEPFAVALHAIDRALPIADGAEVLVIGPGAIGLAVVYGLRALAPGARVTVAGVSPFSDRFAAAAGAHRLVHGQGHALVEQTAQAIGAGVTGNRLSGPVIDRGFDVVFDAVASTTTLDASFRVTRPGGRVVLVGTATRQPVDWTLVWLRELDVVGTAYYGAQEVPRGARFAPGRRRAMQLALELLTDVVPEAMVTHVFPLDRPVDALRTADAGPAAHAVKVAFAP